MSPLVDWWGIRIRLAERRVRGRRRQQLLGEPRPIGQKSAVVGPEILRWNRLRLGLPCQPKQHGETGNGCAQSEQTVKPDLRGQQGCISNLHGGHLPFIEASRLLYRRQRCEAILLRLITVSEETFEAPKGTLEARSKPAGTRPYARIAGCPS